MQERGLTLEEIRDTCRACKDRALRKALPPIDSRLGSGLSWWKVSNCTFLRATGFRRQRNSDNSQSGAVKHSNPERSKDMRRTALTAGLISGEKPVPLEGVRIEGQITGFGARVVIAQRYRNTEAQPIEAVYVFPVDETAAVCGFEALIDTYAWLAKSWSAKRRSNTTTTQWPTDMAPIFSTRSGRMSSLRVLEMCLPVKAF